MLRKLAVPGSRVISGRYSERNFVLFLYRMLANTAGKSVGRVRYSWIGKKCDVGVSTFIYIIRYWCRNYVLVALPPDYVSKKG